jgi:hypothetical protein
METIGKIPYTPLRAVKQKNPARRASQKQPDEKPVTPHLVEAIELAEQQFREGKHTRLETREKLLAFLDAL